MADNGKRRRRTILIGGLAVLTALVSLKWCTNDQPEDTVQPTVQPERNTESADTLRADTLSGFQEDSPSLDAPRHRIAGRRNRRNKVPVQTHETAEGTTASPATPSPAPTPERQEKSIVSPTSETAPDNRQETVSPTASRYTFPRVHSFRAGVRAGAGYSRISGLGNILESYDIRPQFTMEEKGRIVPRFGIFGTWQYSRIGAELGVDYTRLSSKVTEHKIPQDVTETTSFHYDFIMPQLLLRLYATPKFYMGAGIGAAIPFGSRNVDFTDDRGGVVYGQKAERTQDHLRETLKARVHLMPVIKIGYADPKSGLEAALEYSFGTNDLLRTRENDYGYQERTNSAQYVGVTVGYSLPLNKKGEKGK